MKLLRNLYIVLVAVASLFFFYLVYTPCAFTKDYDIKDSDPKIIEPPEPRPPMMTEPKIPEAIEPVHKNHNLQETFEPTPPVPPTVQWKGFLHPPTPDEPLEPGPKTALEPKPRQLMEPLPEYEAPPEPL